MKVLSRLLIAAFFAPIYFGNIQKCKGNELVSITLKIAEAKGTSFEVSSPDLVNFGLNPIAKTQIEPGGIARLEFSLSHSGFFILSFEGAYVPVFVTSGDVLTVKAMRKNGRWDISFAGDGAAINSYLPKVADVANSKYRDIGGESWLTASSARFTIMRDSIKNEQDRLLKNLEKANPLTEETKTLLELKNRVSLIKYEQQFYQSNPKLKEMNPVFFNEIEKRIRTIPYDTIALQANLPEYGEVLNRFLINDIQNSIFKTLRNKDFDSVRIEIPVLNEKEIKRSNYPKPVIDLLLAKNLHFWLRMTGITENLDSLVRNFREDGRSPVYVATVDEFYETLESNAPGKTAPEISGKDHTGKQISLRDLRGKVVYVDVWATWCVPCREEFPNSIKLVDHFKDNKDIVFLFASIDSDVNAWKKLLGDSRTPSGIHLNQSSDELPENILKAYHISGVPNYMLIDKEGKIIQANAPRPSSKIIVSLINKALGQ